MRPRPNHRPYPHAGRAREQIARHLAEGPARAIWGSNPTASPWFYAPHPRTAGRVAAVGQSLRAFTDQLVTVRTLATETLAHINTRTTPRP